MGRRGPKPEPASVKQAKGNPSRRPIGKDPAPVAPVASGKVSPPTWLKKGGLRVWKRLAPRLEAMKLLGAADAETFARYCRNFARWIEVNEYLDSQGSTVYETETGYERVRAAMTVSVRLEPILERIEDRFGLNPSERQRIFAARAATASPDLFGPAKPDAPTTAPAATKGDEHGSPVGFLN